MGSSGGSGGGTTVVEAPKPSAEEIAIQREQLDLMRQEKARMEKAEPLFGEQLELQREGVGMAREQIRQQKALEPFVLRSMGLVREGDTYRQMSEDELVSQLTPTEKLSYDNLKLALERDQRALRGDLPVSEGTRQAKQKEFELFKEAMARGGNPITGDTPETATATTTPGIQSLRQFQERFALVEDAERRGELTAGTALTLQRVGLTSDLGARQAGMLRSLGAPSTAMPGPGGALVRSPGELAAAFGGLLEPLEAQRMLEYNASVMNAQSRAAARAAGGQRNMALGGMLGTLAGAGLGYALAPATGGTSALFSSMALGGMLGGTAGSAGGMIISTKKAKRSITPITRREDRRVLRMIRDLDVKSYRYIWEDDREPKRVGLIAEEAPRELVTSDGQGLDVGRTVGMLMAATRALARERRS